MVNDFWTRMSLDTYFGNKGILAVLPNFGRQNCRPYIRNRMKYAAHCIIKSRTVIIIGLVILHMIDAVLPVKSKVGLALQ